MSLDEACELGERLVAALEDPFDLDGILLDVRASVGLARFPDHGDTVDELLRRADVALYCAKASQQTVEVYAAALDHYTIDRLVLAGQLWRGIEDERDRARSVPAQVPARRRTAAGSGGAGALGAPDARSGGRGRRVHPAGRAHRG